MQHSSLFWMVSEWIEKYGVLGEGGMNRRSWVITNMEMMSPSTSSVQPPLKKTTLFGLLFLNMLQNVISIFTFLKRLFKPVEPWIFPSRLFTWRGTVWTSLSESTRENVNLSNIQLRNVRGVVWISLADFFCQHCH